jgi:hypothetical protein
MRAFIRAEVMMNTEKTKSPSHPAETFSRHVKPEARRAGCPNSPSELDKRLDEALEQTFPASDPISIMVCVR